MLLSDLRKAKRLSPEQVARDLGVSPSTLWRHESGRAQLTPILRRGYGSYYAVPWTEIEQAQP